MIQVLIKIFDSDVGWMDWRFKKVWSRARLKSNTLVVNKKLNQGSGYRMGRKVQMQD